MHITYVIFLSILRSLLHNLFNGMLNSKTGEICNDTSCVSLWKMDRDRRDRFNRWVSWCMLLYAWGISSYRMTVNNYDLTFITTGGLCPCHAGGVLIMWMRINLILMIASTATWREWNSGSYRCTHALDSSLHIVAPVPLVMVLLLPKSTCCFCFLELSCAMSCNSMHCRTR